MEQKENHFSYTHHSSVETISEEDKALLDIASHATRHAYAPYSKFYVGVAIRTMDGDVTEGSNQENSSFPVGQCAERVALYKMVHQSGRKPIHTVAIVVSNEKHLMPASPCGSCRQILSEYSNHQQQPIRLLLGSTNSNEIIEIYDVRHLLPFAFDGAFLGF